MPVDGASCEQRWVSYEPHVSIKMFVLVIFLHFRHTCRKKICSLFSNLTIVSKKIIKPALQPFLAHEAPPALSQNTATPSGRQSLPNFVSTTRSSTKHQSTATGSGEFSFFWSLDTVIALLVNSLGETIPREQIRDVPFTVKNNGAVHGLAQKQFLHIYQITSVFTARSLPT